MIFSSIINSVLLAYHKVYRRHITTDFSALLHNSETSLSCNAFNTYHEWPSTNYYLLTEDFKVS